MEPFKRRFRQGCELLVLEDVQFLGSKTATQLELFHTLAHLLDAGVRVVLSADRLPGAATASSRGCARRWRRAWWRRSSRRTPRCAAGSCAARPPPAASRLPDACLDRLVEGARGSVRDLEGVLIQLSRWRR